MNRCNAGVTCGLLLCVLGACGGRADERGLPQGSGGALNGNEAEMTKTTEEQGGREISTTTASSGDGEDTSTTASSGGIDIPVDDGPPLNEPCACELPGAYITIAEYPASHAPSFGGAEGESDVIVIGQKYTDPPPAGLLTTASCEEYFSPAFAYDMCFDTQIAGCAGDGSCVLITLPEWNQVTVTWTRPDGSVDHSLWAQTSGMPLKTVHTLGAVNGSFDFTTEDGVRVKGEFEVCTLDLDRCLW